MTTREINIILDALSDCQRKILESFDKFDSDIRALDEKSETEWQAMKDILNPQDIADKELKDLESEADMLNQISEDNFREQIGDKI